MEKISYTLSLKFLGNPANVPLKAVLTGVGGGALMAAANEGVKVLQTARNVSCAEQMKDRQYAEWEKRGPLASDADKDALFQRAEEIAQKEVQGLAELTNVVKTIVEKSLE